ncbi:MAG: hypothetical protein K8Q89_01020 [Nitrosarchaeum sp.]|nr:hypothetical protein [Nitrosarchaeum sp.]
MQIFSDDNNMYIKFSTLEKILGVHWSFTIPLDTISEISYERPVQSLREIRMPGTFFPGIIKAGTYLTNRGREFWYTTRNKSFLIIELKNGFYKRIVLSVNESIKNKIQEKIRENLEK